MEIYLGTNYDVMKDSSENNDKHIQETQIDGKVTS